MTVALRSRPRAFVLALVLVLVAGAFMLLVPNRAEAQEPTGAAATKDCPGVAATIGETVTCTFTVENIGFFPGQVTLLTETSPVPGGVPANITCLREDGTTVVATGGTLPPFDTCTGTFQVTIPDNPALCGTLFTDRVDVALLYSQFQVPLRAGAFAEHTTLVLCPPEIEITKTADELSKVGDPVTYTIEVCNVGDVTATRVSVIDTLLGDISPSFAASLAPAACSEAVLTRTVAPGDPDPLPNTVTAIYSVQPFPNLPPVTDTATASASTELFQPDVDVTKTCAPDPIQVGQAELCTIVVTNTGSTDSPELMNGTIADTLTGNLLDPANPAVVDAQSTCTATLAVGASCTVVTTRTVLATDPSPLVNTVTVNYNPYGFPNNITAQATDQVIIEKPGGEGCTPGYWKQEQHFDSWVGYTPDQSFETVFGVDVTLRVGRVDVANPTLLDALNALGGGVNALARHAVAALLNASNPDVASDFSPAEVIDLVQDAIASGDFETAHNLLAAANEQGCPLN